MVIVNTMTKKMVMITTMTMKLMITAMLPTSSPLSARHEASLWRWRLPRRRHQGNRGPHLADQTTFVVMNISIIIILIITTTTTSIIIGNKYCPSSLLLAGLVYVTAFSVTTPNNKTIT